MEHRNHAMRRCAIYTCKSSEERPTGHHRGSAMLVAIDSRELDGHEVVERDGVAGK
jgi:hypothetical protein